MMSGFVSSKRKMKIYRELINNGDNGNYENGLTLSFSSLNFDSFFCAASRRSLINFVTEKSAFCHLLSEWRLQGRAHRHFSSYENLGQLERFL